MAHFTAVLRITRTGTPSTAADARRITHGTPAPKPEREVDEIVALTLRADSLERLVASLGAHTGLLQGGAAE